MLRRQSLYSTSHSHFNTDKVTKLASRDAWFGNVADDSRTRCVGAPVDAPMRKGLLFRMGQECDCRIRSMEARISS